MSVRAKRGTLPELPKKKRMIQSFKPLGYALLCSWVFLVLCLIARFAFGKSSCDWLTPTIGCYVFAFGLISGFFLVRHDPKNLFWAPLWYLVAVSFYHGLGDLYLFWGDNIGPAHMEYTIGYDSISLFEASITNLFGINIVLTVLYTASFLFWVKKDAFYIPPQGLPQLKKVLIFLLIVGGLVRYALFFPSSIGIISTTLPNSLLSLVSLFQTGLMLLAFLSLREGGRWRMVLLILLLIDLPFAFLTLSKSVFLSNVLFLVWGAFLERPKLSYLVVGGLGLFAFYIVIKPIVGQARLLLTQNYGQDALVSWEQRASLVQDSFDPSVADDGPRDQTISWWKRLCFLPFHAYAMERYDEGIRFDSLDKIPFIFVPRFLYPEKPVMTEMGRDFNEMVFGFRTSSLGLGPLAEGYWNYGYAGVVFVASYIGLLLALLSFSVHWILDKQLWILLPFGLQAIELARSPMNWFVPGYVGGIVILVATAFLFWALNAIFVGTSGRESRGRQKISPVLR